MKQICFPRVLKGTLLNNPQLLVFLHPEFYIFFIVIIIQYLVETKRILSRGRMHLSDIPSNYCPICLQRPKVTECENCFRAACAECLQPCTECHKRICSFCQKVVFVLSRSFHQYLSIEHLIILSTSFANLAAAILTILKYLFLFALSMYPSLSQLSLNGILRSKLFVLLQKLFYLCAFICYECLYDDDNNDNNNNNNLIRIIHSQSINAIMGPFSSRFLMLLLFLHLYCISLSAITTLGDLNFTQVIGTGMWLFVFPFSKDSSPSLALYDYLTFFFLFIYIS